MQVLFRWQDRSSELGEGGGQSWSRVGLRTDVASPWRPLRGTPCSPAFLTILADGAPGQGQHCSCWRRRKVVDLRQVAQGSLPPPHSVWSRGVTSLLIPFPSPLPEELPSPCAQTLWIITWKRNVYVLVLTSRKISFEPHTSESRLWPWDLCPFSSSLGVVIVTVGCDMCLYYSSGCWAGLLVCPLSWC